VRYVPKMKTVLEFARGPDREIVLEGTVSEAGLSRLLQHVKERSFAILSGFRGENDLQVNRQTNRRILSLLSSSRLGPIPLIGHWIETDEKGKRHEVREESFFIPKPEDVPIETFQSIVRKALRMSSPPQEEGLIGHDGQVGSITPEGKITWWGSKLSINAISSIYSRLQRKNRKVTFAFEGVICPSSWVEAARLRSSGLHYLREIDGIWRGTFFDV
jgi:hypothetical protein